MTTTPKQAPRAKKRETTPTEYRDAFLKRVATAREALGLNQTKMAELLGLTQGHYKQYESRTIMPHHILVEFCRVTKQHPWYMLTGQSGAFSPGALHSHDRTGNVRPISPAKSRKRD
jgi:DNA-binding transcriptional regulator YiaG